MDLINEMQREMLETRNVRGQAAGERRQDAETPLGARGVQMRVRGLDLPHG